MDEDSTSKDVITTDKSEEQISRTSGEIPSNSTGDSESATGASGKENTHKGTIMNMIPKGNTMFGFIRDDESNGDPKENWFFHLARMAVPVSIDEGKKLTGKRVSFLVYMKDGKKNADNVVILEERDHTSTGEGRDLQSTKKSHDSFDSRDSKRWERNDRTQKSSSWRDPKERKEWGSHWTSRDNSKEVERQPTTHTSTTVLKGVIKRVISNNQFGFITSGSKDYIFYFNENPNLRLWEGMKVTFSRGSTPKGPKAINVVCDELETMSEERDDRESARTKNFAKLPGTKPDLWDAHKLTELLRMVPNKLVLELCTPSFQDLLARTSIKPSWIPAIMGLVDRVLHVTMPQSVIRVLSVLIDSEFFRTHLPMYIEEVLVGDPDLKHDRLDRYLCAFVNVFMELLHRFPSQYIRVPVESLRGAVERLEKEGGNVDEWNALVSLREQIVHEKKEKDRENSANLSKVPRPPNDFRQIPVYPCDEDFAVREPFLRKHIVEGRYEDIEQYLDVFYRLMREDYIYSLREGINAFCNGMDTSGNIRIYQRIYVKSLTPTYGGIVYNLFLDEKLYKRINWKSTKRLLNGGLVCLSMDSFKTKVWATVASREKADKGIVDIKLLHGAQLPLERYYTMVESTVYFEAYCHILERLKNIDPEKLPFKEYLLGLLNEPDIPLYLRDQLTPSIYNLSLIYNDNDEDYDYSAHYPPISRSSIDVINNWSTSGTKLLDESQESAFKLALTSEIALIQGPPGTGKTYVGLKIVQALLKNSHAWKKRSNCPIVIVAMTNHALDQFVEGILSFEESVVRIGGRTSSSSLESKSLYNLRGWRGKPEHLIFDRESLATKINDRLYLLQNRGKIILPISQLKEEFHNRNMIEQLLQKESLETWLELNVVEDKEIATTTLGEIAADVNAIEEEDAEEVKRIEDERSLGVDEFQRAGTDKLEHSTSENRANKIARGLQLGSMKPDPRLLYPYLLTVEERWKIHNFWMDNAVQRAIKELPKEKERYEEIVQMIKEHEEQVDIEIVRKANVVAMTTTGAAKYHRVVQHIGAKILVFEEAAEVLEPHIVTSLTPSLEHLILIGDHKQLRPRTAEHHLATKYNLGVSLFERLVSRRFKCQTLSTQRRMRPEISRLIAPIYPNLVNHPVVTTYEKMKGINTSLYFIEHDKTEAAHVDLRSHYNDHEANFSAKLCRYLLQQEYKASQITILATYSGQVLQIKRSLKDLDIEGVRVSSVDNYQGEENDIVLLSLVRSNTKGEAGYVKMSNRICVALSRARMGFYCIGNIKMLAMQGNLWKTVYEDLVDRGGVGPDLTLVCQTHPTTTKKVSCAADFVDVPEGGCLRPCEARLHCGHVCSKACHVGDHATKCLKPCVRVFPCGHNCPLKCYLSCGKCLIPVEKELPRCGHFKTIPCSTDVWEVKCKVITSHLLNCGHTNNVPCFQDPEKFLCQTPCDKRLDCGHQCPGTCGSCSFGVHAKCKARCGRLLVCSHPCRRNCTKNCPECQRDCENACVHGKCKRTCGEPCIPCCEPCRWECAHYRCTLLCCQLCNRPRCNMPCTEILPCGHPCKGMCGERCDIDLCTTCNPEITDIFFGNEDEEDARFVKLQECNHVLEVTGLDRWVDEDQGQTQKNGTVALKQCPKCKRPIRMSLRYGNSIKQALQDIEAVKKKMRQEQKQLEMISDTLKYEVLAYERKYRYSGTLDKIKSRLFNKEERLSSDEIYTIQNQIPLVKAFDKLMKQMMLLSLREEQFTSIKDKLDVLRERTTERNVTEQEFREIQEAFCVIQLSVNVIRLISYIDFPPEYDTLKNLQQELNQGTITAKRRVEMEKIVEDIGRKAYIPPTRTELADIVKAMKLTQGHWYKCPNGHVYAIGECGGAMEESKCNECGAGIGGTHHRLLSDNRRAEMDEEPIVYPDPE